MARNDRRKRGNPAKDWEESERREKALDNVTKKASGVVPRKIQNKKQRENNTTAEDSTTTTENNDDASEITMAEDNTTTTAIEKNTDASEVISPPGNVVSVVTSKSADSSTKKYTPSLSTSDVCSYQIPFTIYERFIPGDGWNKDSDVSIPYDIFPVTGERRKKEVKDNFDWLLPVKRPADVAAARAAYDDTYNFNEGVHTYDKTASQSKYSIPTQIMSRYTNYTTYAMPLDHPLCNVEQTTNWLVKPVAQLLNRINSATHRTQTRSSLKEACLGQDLFIHSAFSAADEFVTSSDDIELINFVHGDGAKKIWHCSRTDQSDMLSKACIQAFLSVHEIYPDIFSDRPDWLLSMQNGNKCIQFLGIVSLYQNQSGTKVIAFRLHSFVLYSFDNKSKSTVVHLALTETRLTGSTAQERLLQIRQMIQSDHVGSAALKIAPHFFLSKEVEAAYFHLGFSKIAGQSDRQCSAALSRNDIIKLPRFTNRIMWGRFGTYLSLPLECEVGGPFVNMFCRIVSDLFLRPTDPVQSLGVRFEEKQIHAAVLTSLQLSNGIEKDVGLCSETVRSIATSLTRIPIAVVTHAIVHRVSQSKSNKAFHETTLELLQHISIALVKVVPYHEAFVGDSNSCVLYCEKCKRRFGRTGNIFQILAEASNAILYHNGLELPRTSVETSDDEEVRFENSLPMHTAPISTGQFSFAVIDAMDPDHDRCKYGTGRCGLSRIDKQRNIMYLHNLDEAMRIDSYLSESKECITNRNICTSSLLFVTLDASLHHHFRERSPTKLGGDVDSFKDYAVEVNNAQDVGTIWIESNCDPTLANQHRVLLGWSYVLTQQFLLNYSYLSRRIYEQIELQPGSRPLYNIQDLLGVIGLDDRVPQLQSSCEEYSMLSESIHDFTCVLCDSEICMKMSNCLAKRPHLENVDDSISDRGIISKLGRGWEESITATWFAKNVALNERRISTLFEAEESVLILKTLHSITLVYENEKGGRGYSMSCNVDDILKKKPDLRVGRFQKFFENPTFECSNAMVTSLPFDFVKQLRVGKTVHLPKEWKAAVKKDAQLANSSIMTSIQLWRHSLHMDENGKSTVTRVYRVVYDNTDRNQSSKKSIYVTEKVATSNLRSEPWILDHVSPLCSVRSYRQVVLGEGGKTSKSEYEATDPSVRENYWYCKDNHSKLCTEGAIANMLFHMNLRHEAEEFRNLVIKPDAEILIALGETNLPKRVRDGKNGSDPMEKCMWLLERKYKCRRLTYLNPEQHKSAEKVVSNLRQLTLPVLISVMGRDSVYNHVVVVFRGQIIDFESKAPYPLTVLNVENICGPRNPFLKVSRGYVICPSRKMKSSVGDLSDWGENTVMSQSRHLFTTRV